MRANLLFILGLITISCVLSTETSFSSELNSNAEFKSLVESIKAQDNMGSVIVSMAELETEGRWSALFSAVDKLSAWLVKDRATENKQFKLDVAAHTVEKARLNRVKAHQHARWAWARNLLRNKLVPRRNELRRLIKSQQAQVKALRANLKQLRSARVHQIAVFKQRSALLLQGIAALKRALPILQGLQNGQSFAELDADLFAQVSQELKSSLSQLDMGELHTVFVESMIATLNQQNFVNQAQLAKIVKLVQNLLARLQAGLKTLDNNEASHLKRFNSSQAQLVAAIKALSQLLLKNQARLVRVDATIKRVRAYKKAKWARYQTSIRSLALLHKQWVARVTAHKQFIHDVDVEESTVAAAVRVLTKGGVTRSS